MAARGRLIHLTKSLGGLLACALALSGCRLGGDVTAAPAAAAAPIPYVPIPTIAVPSASPFYSRGSSLTITGLCAQGELVQLSGDSTASTVCTNSSYSFTVPRTNDGIYSFLVYQRDSNQNPSASVAQVWVRKTSIPQPSLIVPATSSFASALPFLTMTGACESNATVSLGGDATGSQPCMNATFSFNVAKAADGDYTIVVAQTDPAGNSASTSVVWNKHVIAAVPSAPNLKVGLAQSIQLSGGSGTYTISLSTNASGASLSATSANRFNPFTYTAGPTANVTDIIHVVDSLGSTLDIPVTTAPNVADHFKITAGNAQSRTIGKTLTVNPKVQIVDRYGNGVPNQKVRFQVTNGDAKIVGKTIITSDSTGAASVVLKMGISHLQNTIFVSAFAGLLPDLAGSGNATVKIVENSSVNAGNTGNFGLSFPTVTLPGAIVKANFGGAHTDQLHQDIAVINASGTATLGILRNLGNGLFSSSNLATCSGPQALAVGDFNNDGLIDIAVSCNAGVVAIHKGNIDGTFQAPVNFTSAPGPISIVAGDFRNSGKLDLAIASSNGVIELQPGNGDGTFGAAAVIANQATFTPSVLRAADINHDGVPDLILLNGSPQSSVSVLINLNDHAGGFAANVDFPTGTDPADLVIGDFNSDGYADVAVVNSSDATVGFFLNDSTAHMLTAMQTEHVGSQPSVVATADFNVSGYAKDIVVVNSSDSNVGILPNLTLPGQMTLTFDAMQTVDYLLAPTALVVANVNGDTKPDLVTSIQSSPSVINVLQGKGSYEFGNQTTVGTAPIALASGAITGGTYPDVAVVNQNSNTVTILKGVGQGEYTLINTVATSASPVAIALADMNGDGFLDLIVVSKNSKIVSVFLGNGDGTFHNSYDTSVGNAPAALVVGDFNGDGNLDVAVSNTQTGTVSVLLGAGDGTLNAKVDYTVGLGPIGIALQDFNGDGVLDIVTANSNDDSVSVLLGVGDGTFRSSVAYAVGSGPRALQAIDITGDGATDLAVLNAGDGTISIMRGLGDGSFTPKSTLSSGGGDVKDIAAGDFHGLGRIDLAVTNGDSTAALFAGRGDGTFQPPTVLSSTNGGAAYGSLTTTDLNGDGIVDLLILDNANNKLETWLGQ